MNILIYIQQDATLRNCSTCFGWYHHLSSGAQTTVSTASGICHAVIALCPCRGRVGTGLSVLRVAYATHSLIVLKVCLYKDIILLTTCSAIRNSASQMHQTTHTRSFFMAEKYIIMLNGYSRPQKITADKRGTSISDSLLHRLV